MTRVTYSLGAVLSVVTGTVLTGNIGDLYNILDYMTGDLLWTHQLPRACTVCKPHILAQHPGLADVDASNVTPDNWHEWLDRQGARFGDALPIVPLAEGWRHIDPVDELVSMVGEEKVAITGPDIWPVAKEANGEP